MDRQIAEQCGIGLLLLLAGASGWLLPYKWSLLRLRRGLDRLVPERINQAIPRIVGVILALSGLGILVGTAIVGRFQ